ncbi:unnamed protein product [Citrullus colocynthis]|uniref:Uncharacterized protein n=1 Tax=Citrullus colocynthis TaxID=252529 RepID=A0ABP0Z4J1_9ROSI
MLPSVFRVIISVVLHQKSVFGIRILIGNSKSYSFIHSIISVPRDSRIPSMIVVELNHITSEVPSHWVELGAMSVCALSDCGETGSYLDVIWHNGQSHLQQCSLEHKPHLVPSVWSSFTGLLEPSRLLGQSVDEVVWFGSRYRCHPSMGCLDLQELFIACNVLVGKISLHMEEFCGGSSVERLSFRREILRSQEVWVSPESGFWRINTDASWSELEGDLSELSSFVEEMVIFCSCGFLLLVYAVYEWVGASLGSCCSVEW